MGTAKKAFRSKSASRVPDLSQTEPLLLTISTRWFGPAATWVSGGVTNWSIPNGAANCWSSEIIGNFVNTFSTALVADGPAGRVVTPIALACGRAAPPGVSRRNGRVRWVAAAEYAGRDLTRTEPDRSSMTGRKAGGVSGAVEAKAGIELASSMAVANTTRRA